MGEEVASGRATAKREGTVDVTTTTTTTPLRPPQQQQQQPHEIPPRGTSGLRRQRQLSERGQAALKEKEKEIEERERRRTQRVSSAQRSLKAASVLSDTAIAITKTTGRSRGAWPAGEKTVDLRTGRRGLEGVVQEGGSGSGSGRGKVPAQAQAQAQAQAPTHFPRRSPEPHPQPKRYVLKFKRQLLEQAQRKEDAERDRVRQLLGRQWEDAVCASTLVREVDLEMVPALEGPLQLRSGRPRGLRSGGVPELSNGGHSKGGGDAAAAGHRAGRPRGRKGSVVKLDEPRLVKRPVEEMNGIAEETAIEVDPRHPEPEPEPPQVKKPRKMELELRIDDKSTKDDKDADGLERNIDNVIFGDVTFKSWYPSWYPKEIIGEKALTVGPSDKGGIVVSELYVCRRCFGYAKVLVEWVRHCRCCEKGIPGKKVYVHGGWREEGAVRGATGDWSVWEVDGGVETLFCQKLSLFAKLFLDNKSVFFDVSGFNYFLLVYTPPANSPHVTNPNSPPSPQITGFFSKEKMSWDNNNLACILIFPPWQRKGLGALLMGVSYAIARREGIMGGPEKPISELGRKGYKRFWGAEVARWILTRPESGRKGGKGGGKIRKPEVVGIEVISRETWIAAEDCLGVLRDMGVVERIDREAVRAWCERLGVSLQPVVGEDGFVPGYAERIEVDAETGEGMEGVEGEEEEMGD
ncbi:MOZ/SAS family protein [Drepanopeziza brunnea f. sp. 'multigermtubi' MB_m1]|uniref:histone acetyltransferase n=1 Tax=Marssonina brunnea f. sp. multigermtubi (strain MB_m1) TaxID=1072389 RepID=K1XU74_MARBU|nr:MOZ/SAS family protein [Drepanopeziza brunnea f. sp. 'multigermtubi' MB_m1]EKD16164.1 MOZ/SAS family protein [Drepanopeziza brunnea f. sp. 'multigermtubi' MB_m1]